MVSPSTASPSQEWMPDFAAEGMLRRLGVHWDYLVSVPIQQISSGSSASDQPRLRKPIDFSKVDQYARDMHESVAFPSLVAYRRADATYIVLQGNHRLRAAKKARRTSCDLYVVDAPDQKTRYLIATTFNRANGLPSDPEEDLEHAVIAVKEYGMPVIAAAREYGVKQTTLRDEIAFRASKERLEPASVVLNRTQMIVLDKIANLHVLRDAAQLAADAQLSAEELMHVYKEIEAAEQTEQAQRQVIAAYRARSDVQRRIADCGRGLGPNRQQRRAHGQLLSLLGQVETLLKKHPTLDALGVTDAECVDLIPRFVGGACSFNRLKDEAEVRVASIKP